MTQTPPPPGAFGLTTMTGWYAPLVRLGQTLYDSPSRFGHAFLVLDHGQVLEAEPGGARVVPIGDYLSRADVGDDVVFCDGPVLDWLAAHPRTDPAVFRRDLCARARHFVGTPYSWADYASLVLHRLGVRPRWVEAYVRSTHHAQCAQLVDEAYHAAGIRLYDDGRWPGDVVPGDLDAWRTAWDACHHGSLVASHFNPHLVSGGRRVHRDQRRLARQHGCIQHGTTCLLLAPR